VLSFADKEEFSRCGHPNFLVQKTPDFLKFMGCSHGKKGEGGSEPVRPFFGQGGVGQFFAILCRSFLWTAFF